MSESIGGKIRLMFRRNQLLCAMLAGSSLLLTLVSTVQAQDPRDPSKSPAVATTANLHPVLIELFTSEGCSSCPPADILIQKLDTYQPIAGAELIVMSEHVTYWDHDGWKDPNSSPALTDRQSAYEGALGEKESFTPQLIVDGLRELNITNPQQMEQILNQAKDEAKIPLTIGEVSLDPNDPTTLRAHIETDVNGSKHNADVYVVLALDHVESQVLRGENGGKHLVHVAVVKKITKLGKLPKGKTFTTDFQEKLAPGEDAKSMRLIAFIQESGPGAVLGAAMRKPGN
jgi:hypothetical protein